MRKAGWLGNLPLLLLLAANLVAGMLVYRDFGLSWDEPLFYQYAAAVPYAYSIRARLSGDFNLENAYGPSAEDHKNYGPAYLLLARPAAVLLDKLLPGGEPEAWHLTNFLAFQVGVVFFYLLCRRWLADWAAFAAVLIFSSQPVLWGHAWINPKDVPFMSGFIITLYLGLRMADQLAQPGAAAAPAPRSPEASQRSWLTLRRRMQIWGGVFIVFALAAYIFSAQWVELLRQVIESAYAAPPGSLAGRLFGWLAANAGSVPVEAYVGKALILFGRLKLVLAVLAVLSGLPALALSLWLPGVQKLASWAADRLAPLPVWPAWHFRLRQLLPIVGIILPAGILLGALSSVRILGPLAGALVALYFLLKHQPRPWVGLVLYALLALGVLYAAWPYLWEDPLGRFVEVLRHMSSNPKVIPVLFRGTVYPSDGLPFTYLPVMLATSLTWPVWPLFLVGLGAAAAGVLQRRLDWRSLLPMLLWFLIPFGYVLVRRPPMYDGYRHFLFMLPPVFIFIGLALQAVLPRLRRAWAAGLLLLALVLPGALGMAKLHPYPYTYYNFLVGGTGGAFRLYETDYWLTCYKELVPQAAEVALPGTTLFVHRQPSIAQAYAPTGLAVERFDPDADETFPGSLLLLTTRANVDLSIHPEAPELLSVGREGAVFCLVKGIP